MTNSIIDLDEKFMNWFHERESYHLRSERFYDDVNVQSAESRANIMTSWLRAAYIYGVAVAAQDSVDTLNQYGTSVAGVTEPLCNLTECYDRSAGNLLAYWDDVLDKDN